MYLNIYYIENVCVCAYVSWESTQLCIIRTVYRKEPIIYICLIFVAPTNGTWLGCATNDIARKGEITEITPLQTTEANGSYGGFLSRGDHRKSSKSWISVYFSIDLKHPWWLGHPGIPHDLRNNACLGRRFLDRTGGAGGKEHRHGCTRGRGLGGFRGMSCVGNMSENHWGMSIDVYWWWLGLLGLSGPVFDVSWCPFPF